MIAIEHDTTARKNACPTPTLGTVIGNYKAPVSREIRQIDPNQIVWQARYLDHVIRNQQDYEAVWRYIDENPLKWELDEYY